MLKRNLLHYLIATSLAIPVPALADNANITFYGVANVSYDFVNTGTSTAGIQGTTVNKVSSNASRFGIKGSEEVGEGITANWQIESLIALDNAGGTFATRNSYAGLSHNNYGSVLLGRYDTPYKISTRRLDNFADSIGDNRSLMGSITGISASTAFDGRQPDVFAYTTPLMSGFSLAVARANLAETTTKATDAKATATSFAGIYDSGTLYGSLAYETHHLDTVRIGGKESAWKAGFGYTMGDYSFGLAYEKSSDTLGGATAPTSCTALAAGSNCVGHSALYLTGKYTFDNNAVKLACTKVGNLGTAANTGAKQFSLGYDHRISKRTTLFVVYTKLTNDSKANYGLGNSAFSTAATTSIGAGADPSALSFGMKHVF